MTNTTNTTTTAATVTLTEAELKARLQAMQGTRGNAEFAREIGVTWQYLHDYYVGVRPIGPKLLAVLGVRREYVYTAVAGGGEGNVAQPSAASASTQEGHADAHRDE